MGRKVFIGVGHGGADSGACANGLKEKDINLGIALACRDELERHGVEVLMSRTKDESDPLKDEIKECNAYKPDLALDIHNNAGGGDGAEVYHYSKGGVSKSLAQNILNALIALGQNSRGLKTKLGAGGKDYFGFIRDITCPSVIVECAFIDNAKDVQFTSTLARQRCVGVGIAKGVLKTLGIAFKPVQTNNPAPVAKPQNNGNTVNVPGMSVQDTSNLYKVTGAWCWIRTGAGTNFSKNGKVKRGQVYTIVSTAAGQGANLWGKLKSGSGWISLDFCKRV